uniref:Glycine-rich protein n=1 Tax=Oryza punctata TaxID=4537 RepID=A0A0E0K1P5_ORYPU
MASKGLVVFALLLAAAFLATSEANSQPAYPPATGGNGQAGGSAGHGKSVGYVAPYYPGPWWWPNGGFYPPPFNGGPGWYDPQFGCPFGCCGYGAFGQCFQCCARPWFPFWWP